MEDNGGNGNGGKTIDLLLRIAKATEETNARLDAGIERLDSRIDETNRRLENLTRETREGFRDVNMRLDGVNNRIDDLSDRIDETNAKLDQTNARLDNGFRFLGKYHDDHEERIRALEAIVLKPAG